MISDLKPYAEYKESSHAWLGNVPQHWSVVPNRALFAEVKDRNHPDEEMLSVTITRGIVRQSALLVGSSKKDSSNLDKSAYKLVQPRDIAYNKMRAWQGAIGASALRGIISPAYVVMRLREDDDLPSYFHHLYRTPQFAKEAERWSYGITSDMWSLRPEHFKMIYTPEPPPAEQAAIVRFLDWANGRLERAILAKRKVIALLGEQKQAIIHRAVTRGLDPSVPLKPSGIPWLGDIPQHWEVMPLMRLFAEVYRYPTYYDIQYAKYGVPEVRGEALVHGKIVELPDQRYISQETNSRFPRTILKEGDLVMSVRGTIGKIGVVGESHVGANITANLLRLCPRQEVAHSYYLSWLMRSPGFLSELDRVSPQTTIKTITMPQLAGLRLCVPPPPEQRAIVGDVEKSTGSVNTAISRLEREIDLLREYRTRLVADVVTGKLDVRDLPAATLAAQAGAAARLPEGGAESAIEPDRAGEDEGCDELSEAEA